MFYQLKKLRTYFLIILLVTACSESPTQNNTDSNQTYLGETAPNTQSLIFKQGSISTSSFEFGMAIHPDLNEFYFTRLNSSFNGTIMVCKNNNNIWITPVPALFSGSYNDSEPFITTDGRYLFFTSYRLSLSADDLPHLWYVERDNGIWSGPGIINFEAESIIGERNPSLTTDGTLYFTADFPSIGGEGLYCCKKVNGIFQEPEFCDVLTNTNGIVEVEPFIANDGNYVLFYSAGRADNFTPNGSIGDIYISFRNADDSWSDPLNLGSSVNTTSEESHPSLSPDGKYLFFARNNGQSNGFVDIYWIDASFLTGLR